MPRALEPCERGVLRTPDEDRFQLHRWEPSEPLRPYVAWLWAVAWSLPEREEHQQAVLPHPSAHLVVEDGAATLHGPPRRRFDRVLRGTGRVVGARFRPGGVRPLLAGPVAELTDRTRPAAVLPGLDDAALVDGVQGARELARAATVLDTALRPLLPARPDPSVALADRAVTMMADDRGLTRVPDLALRLHVSTRSLQRLFHDYVGLPVGWVLRRYRLHDLAEHALSGRPVDWGELADRLGYADQAHLIRDFTGAVGTSPARYAAESAGRSHSSR
ncbi:MAG TPA: helix-turn-helix domain-containing protein [Mycobacteriales bacterium]|nr:helix-turn-helix domain-containing protein [Mycobacteriales bacterium]